MITTVHTYLGDFPYSPPKEYTKEDFPTGLPDLEGAKEVFKKSLDSQRESLEFWKGKKFSFWNTQVDVGNTVGYLYLIGAASVIQIILMSSKVGITIKIAGAVIGIALLIFGKMVYSVYSQLKRLSSRRMAWETVIFNYCSGPRKDSAIEKREFEKRVWLSITKDFFDNMSLEMKKINSSNRDETMKQIRGQFDLFPRGIYNVEVLHEKFKPIHLKYWTQIIVDARRILTAVRSISTEFAKLDKKLANTSAFQVENAINSELDDIQTIFSKMGLGYLKN